jgi:hypothetical protein
MDHRTAIGVYDSYTTAERARRQLIGAGVPIDRISLSTELTGDLAAEVPGQAYENQSMEGSATALTWLRSLLRRKPATDTDRARYSSAVQTGSCVLSVTATSATDCKALLGLLLRAGALRAMERPEM